MTNAQRVKEILNGEGLLLVVAAALRDRNDRVLVQRRPVGRSMAGLWEFPGGKVEAGEGPEDALIRELREELGIVVASADLAPMSFTSGKIGERRLLLLLYRVRAWTGEPLPLEADALRWCTGAELRALAMPPADKPFLDLF